MLTRRPRLLTQIITAGVWAANIGLAVSVFLRIKIPGIFATPSIFALVVFPLMVATLYPFRKRRSYREVAAKLGILTFYLLLLLAFRHLVFTGEPSRGFFSVDFYFMMVLIVGSYWIDVLSQVLLRRSVPVPLWVIIVPAVILLIHWFLFPETTMSELKVPAVIILAATPIGFLWIRLREAILRDGQMSQRKKMTLTLGLILGPLLLGGAMGPLGHVLGIPTGLTDEELIRLLIAPETQQGWMVVMLYRLGFLFMTAMTVTLLVVHIGACWGWRYGLLAIVSIVAPLLLFWSLVEVGIIIAFSVLSVGNSYLIQHAPIHRA